MWRGRKPTVLDTLSGNGEGVREKDNTQDGDNGALVWEPLRNPGVADRMDDVIGQDRVGSALLSGERDRL